MTDKPYRPPGHIPEPRIPEVRLPSITLPPSRPFPPTRALPPSRPFPPTPRFPAPFIPDAGVAYDPPCFPGARPRKSAS
jgi:hypothetical protein